MQCKQVFATRFLPKETMKQAWLVLHTNENSGLAKQEAQRLEFPMSLFAGSTLPWRAGEYQTACAAPSFKTNNPKPPKNPLSAPWNRIVIFALNPLKITKEKVMPRIKSSERDTQLYIAKSKGQSQHFCIISSNAINQEQKENRTTKT